MSKDNRHVEFFSVERLADPLMQDRRTFAGITEPGWYHWCEDEATAIGPYETEATASHMGRVYAAWELDALPPGHFKVLVNGRLEVFETAAGKDLRRTFEMRRRTVLPFPPVMHGLRLFACPGDDSVVFSDEIMTAEWCEARRIFRITGIRVDVRLPRDAKLDGHVKRLRRFGWTFPRLDQSEADRLKQEAAAADISGNVASEQK